jgi:hypothetical protein
MRQLRRRIQATKALITHRRRRQRPATSRGHYFPMPGETKVASLQKASEVREETTKVDSDVQDTAGAGGADSAQVQLCTPSVEEKPPASPTTSTKDGGVEEGGQSDSSTESCAKASEKSADNQIMIDIMNKMAADADKRAAEADKRAAEAERGLLKP